MLLLPLLRQQLNLLLPHQRKAVEVTLVIQTTAAVEDILAVVEEAIVEEAIVVLLTLTTILSIPALLSMPHPLDRLSLNLPHTHKVYQPIPNGSSQLSPSRRHIISPKLEPWHIPNPTIPRLLHRIRTHLQYNRKTQTPTTGMVALNILHNTPLPIYNHHHPLIIRAVVASIKHPLRAMA